jgi:hypothetical protein
MFFFFFLRLLDGQDSDGSVTLPVMFGLAALCLVTQIVVVIGQTIRIYKRISRTKYNFHPEVKEHPLQQQQQMNAISGDSNNHPPTYDEVLKNRQTNAPYNVQKV